LLASLGLRAGEAAVPGRDPPEPALARPELRPRAVLHPLDLELDVLVAERTVPADTLGHLHGGGPSIDTEENCYLRVPGSPTPCPRTASTADDDRSRTAPEHPGIPIRVEHSPVASQQIYIAKLINGGEFQRAGRSASAEGTKRWWTC